MVRVFAERVGGKGPAFGYLIEYHDPLSGARKTAREPQGLLFQEFRIGDRVTAFVTRRGDIAEILSWKRLALSLLVIALVVLALGISYHFLIGKKIV